MLKIVVTGSSGFIGKSVVACAAERGHSVVGLTRKDWQLGKPLPPQHLDAEIVVHLASASLAARDNQSAAAILDVEGTGIILNQWRALPSASRRRFIFVSSQSARQNAGNNYGRSKYAIEKLMTGENEITIRPGLVYDWTGGSVFGLFEMLARFPVIPIFAPQACIQPIEVKELASCIIRVAELERPQRLYELGLPTPLTLLDMVRLVAQRSGTRPPLSFPFPSMPIRMAAWLADRTFRLSPSLLERINGLIALRPMDTATSLAALDVALVPFDSRVRT